MRNSSSTARRVEKALQEAEGLALRFQAADDSLRKVVLFGSLAEGTVRAETFDIDLAVVSENSIRLMGIAEESVFAVDVAELDRLPAGYRQRVHERGITLYEKK